MLTRRGFVAGSMAGIAAVPFDSRAAVEAFRMAYFETYRPLSCTDGGIRGLLVDILDELLSRQMQMLCSHEGSRGRGRRAWSNKGSETASAPSRRRSG